MTRDEWIKARAEDRGSFGPLGPPSYAAWDGSDYDHLCRLIDSRIAAALENRDAEAMASASAAWSAKEHADAAALAAKSAEPPTYSRREPVADEDRPPTGERFGCRIEKFKNGNCNVVSPCGTKEYWRRDGWVDHDDTSGYFHDENDARAALAKAPPPLGWVETAKAVKEVTRDELTEYLNTFMAGQPTQKHADAIMARFTLTRKPTP